MTPIGYSSKLKYINPSTILKLVYSMMKSLTLIVQDGIPLLWFRFKFHKKWSCCIKYSLSIFYAPKFYLA